MQTQPADFTQLNYAFEPPRLSGEIKRNPEDFIVEEVLGYELSGEGEHLWCWVEKRQQNTDWVAGALAKWAGTSKRNVGFAGQKDRQAITRQWFSIALPGKQDPIADALAVEGVVILKMRRHHRKLQRGGLAGNQFQLTIRNIGRASDAMEGSEPDSPRQSVEKRLDQISELGFPNYFGKQRFGHHGNNLVEGEKLMLQSAQNSRSESRQQGRNRRNGQRNKQSLYISSLRSWMFNEIVSRRILANSWNRVLEGDVVLLSGSNTWFVASSDELDSLQRRSNLGDLQPTGALLGDGPIPTEGTMFVLEQAISDEYRVWCEGLEARRIKPDRRALRVMPKGLNWTWSGKDASEVVTLTFFLPAGAFATMLLREVFLLKEG